MRPALAPLLLVLTAAASADAQVYRFKTYTSSSGLPNNSVYHIYQDGKGYVWFATDGGAARYDGVSFATFGVAEGLVDASVRAIVEDGRGDLWFLTKGGASRWDGRRFTHYTSADGLPHDEVRSGLRARDGSLWFGTTHGLARWDGSSFRRWTEAEGLPAAPVWALHEDRRGTLWVGLRGGGVARLEGERFRVLTRADGLPGLDVFAIAEHPDGALWMATGAGLVRWEDGRVRTFTTADGLPGDSVSSVVVDRHGRVWCGVFGGGVARLDDGRFTVFGRANGVPDPYVMSLLKDRENNIWFGTMWGGAFRFVSEHFANFTTASGLGAGLVSGVAEDGSGRLWFSSVSEGLTAFEGSRVRRVREGATLPDERVWSLFVEPGGTVWTGGLSGVHALAPDAARARHFGLEELGLPDRINAIVKDATGRMWFGSGAARSTGVVSWDGRAFRRWTTADGLAHNQVNGFALDAGGRLWVCTEDGVSRLDGERFTTWRRADGLPAKRVLTAHGDGAGLVWLGTPAGLVRYDGQAFRVFRTRDGLVNDFVSALTSDGAVLWVGTAGGISAFDGRTFDNYTVKDGLVSHEVSLGAALRRADGTLWFGTPAGAVRYQPVKDTTLPVPPWVYVRGLRVRDQAREPSPAGLTLEHDQNSVSFEFLGLSFTDEEAIRYSYLMEGLERTWSGPDPARSVRFMNLPPGDYRFLVKARSAAGLWSAPAAVELHVRPAFWQTGAFRVLVAAVLGGLAFSAYSWRMRVVAERHRERVTELRRLMDSIRVINAGLDLPAVLQNIASEAARLVGGEPGAIGLVRKGRVAFPRVWLEGRWEPCDLTVGVGEGVAGAVAATGRAQIVNDPGEERGAGPASWFARAWSRGFMDVPIVDREGAVVGVLDVRRGAATPPFDDDDRQLLESLAHQAAVAIENARLYGDLEEKRVLLGESVWAIEELYKNEQQTTRILQDVNDMKTSFLIVTSHEMRTPLTILKGHTEALLGGFLGEITATQRATVEICHRTIDRMIATFNDILEMLKIDRQAALDPQPIDLAFEVEQVVKELRPHAENRGQRLLFHAPPELPTVVADTEKIQLVVDNLVRNAIKFTPDGGQIRVRVEGLSDGVRLTVEDEGVGIAADELEKVFERFYTGADARHHSSGQFRFGTRGSGLGLAIAKGYVEAHGGRIWAESAGPGQGSRFHVVLPVSGRAAAASAVA